MIHTLKILNWLSPELRQDLLQDYVIGKYGNEEQFSKMVYDSLCKGISDACVKQTSYRITKCLE